MALTLFITPQALAGFIDESDIPVWAEEAIEVVKEAEIMKGFGDGSFRPKQNLTRAEAVTLITRAKKDFEDFYNGEPQFPDVPKGVWFEEAVGHAANHGWIKGHDDGFFRPGDNLTRAEFSAMVMRAFHLESGEPEDLPFADVSDRLWFFGPVSALYENDLLRNARNKYYRPANLVSRAEAAWTFGQIVQRPGLTGEMGEVSHVDGVKVDTRRVAIKPRDFNVNDQSYDIERQALHADATPASESEVNMNISSDWKDMGVLRIRNTLDHKADLESIRLRIRFDRDDMGPREGFWLRLTGSGVEKDQRLYSNGGAAFTGLNKAIESGHELVFKVFLKPEPNESFYSTTGTGKLSLVEIGGEAFKSFVKSNEDRYGELIKAPVEYDNWDFSKFKFEPVVGPEPEATAETMAPKLYADNGVTFQYPPDWELEENYLGAFAFLVSPQDNAEDHLTENINLVREPLDIPLSSAGINDYMNEVFEELKVLKNSFNVVSDTESQIHGFKTREVEYTANIKEKPMRFKQVIVFKSDEIYILTFTAGSETFQEHLPLFEDVLESLDFL